MIGKAEAVNKANKEAYEERLKLEPILQNWIGKKVGTKRGYMTERFGQDLGHELSHRVYIIGSFLLYRGRYTGEYDQKRPEYFLGLLNDDGVLVAIHELPTEPKYYTSEEVAAAQVRIQQLNDELYQIKKEFSDFLN